MTSGRRYFTGFLSYPIPARQSSVIHGTLSSRWGIPFSFPSVHKPTRALVVRGGSDVSRLLERKFQAILNPGGCRLPTAALRIFTSPQRCRNNIFPAFLGSAVPSQRPSVLCGLGFLIVVPATAAPGILPTPVGPTGRPILRGALIVSLFLGTLLWEA